VTPLILAVDTTHEHGSLALTRGSKLLEELPLHAPHGYGDVLYSSLAAILGRQGVQVADVDLFAAASGPGSFTGVRVGLACVKGLAMAAGRPAVAVSNLAALAQFGSTPLRAPILDARRGDIYAALYDHAGRVVVPEQVTKLPAWLAALPPGEVEFVSNDFAAFGELPPDARRVTAPRGLAAAVARIASESDPQDPAALDANYVRRADAELFWKE
jgi:tRNA threonylcarbamoyladenosine biosynthesis protein TsaB